MPKQPPRNGYYYFMRDFREREERAGRRFHGGMTEVATAAADEWKHLPQIEKDHYNEYAKENRYNEVRKNVPAKKKPLEKKFNSQGISLAEVERKEKLELERAASTSKFILDFVAAKDIDNLKHDLMCLIHVNIFCKTDDDTYYPAELAICKFNIKEGPIDVYHTFFDPGEIKKGYGFAMKEHSDKTHKITLSYVQERNRFKNYEVIYDEICNFLKSGDGQSTPLFTMYDDVTQNTSMIAVEKTLATLWGNKYSAPQEDEVWRKYFPLYPLPLLFFEFMKYCYLRGGSTSEGFPNSIVATSELSKDTYNFRDEFGCDFHQEECAVVFCSKSYVLRWANLIRDHCSLPLGISFPEADKTEDYNSAISESFCGNHNYQDDDDDDDDNDDDHFTDCYSTVSRVSSKTTKTNFTEEDVRYSYEDDNIHDDERGRPPVNNVASNVHPSPSWNLRLRGKGRGRRSTAAPPVNDDDFPALGGVGRGMQSMNLNR